MGHNNQSNKGDELKIIKLKDIQNVHFIIPLHSLPVTLLFIIFQLNDLFSLYVKSNK